MLWFVKTKPNQHDHMRALAQEVYDSFAETFNFRSSEAAEEWGTSMYQHLQCLLDDTYSGEDKEFMDSVEQYTVVVEYLMGRPELNDIMNDQARALLGTGLDLVIDRVNNAIAAQMSEAEASMFCLLASGGRAMFEAGGLDPDSFMPKEIYDLAESIRENYPRYRETIQGYRT